MSGGIERDGDESPLAEDERLGGSYRDCRSRGFPGKLQFAISEEEKLIGIAFGEETLLAGKFIRFIPETECLVACEANDGVVSRRELCRGAKHDTCHHVLFISSSILESHPPCDCLPDNFLLG